MYEKTAIILGGGPAGCQCALWLKMLGYHPMIMEQQSILGGLQAKSPYQNNWMIGTMQKTGVQFAQAMEKHIQSMDIDVLYNTHVKQITHHSNHFIVEIHQKKITTHFFVIATGVKPKRHDLHASPQIIIGPGERLFAYDFKDKRVAILGGGDNAYENYTFVLNKGAKHCDIYARTIRSRQQLLKEVEPENVYTGPYIVNQDNLSVTHQQTLHYYDVILVLYGWEANFPEALKPWEDQLLDENGFILTDANCRTPIVNMFAIGEVANRMHPCVTTAMADGVTAAKAIQKEMDSKIN